MTSRSVARAGGLESHETDDGLVVFNPATDCVHHLNYSAAVIFELCSDPVAVEALPALVAKLYGVEEVPSDALEQCLNQLLELGVLKEI